MENFKAFGPSGTTIPLGKLTLIYGPNSGGKSSVLKAVARVAQTRLRKKQDPGFNLDWVAVGPWFDLGNSFQVLHEGKGTKFKIGFEFEYTSSLANWQKKRGSKETWKHPEGELVSKGKATQTWRWKLPAEIPENGCIRLFNGDEWWIIQSTLHPTDEELIKFNQEAMDSHEDLTPDMVTVEGREITVRIKSDQLKIDPKIQLKRCINVKSRFVYVFEFPKGHTKRTILSGIEYYERREGKMQLIFSGEVVEDSVPVWINGNIDHIHSSHSAPQRLMDSWFPKYRENYTYMKLKWAPDTDCIVYSGCKSNNFDEMKLSMADNAIFLKMMRAYVAADEVRGSYPSEGEREESQGSVENITPYRIWNEINQIETRLWDEIIEIHPKESSARAESWDTFWPKLHDEIRQETEKWNINITTRMKEMLSRLIVRHENNEYPRPGRGYWPSSLFRYWTSAALHLNDGVMRYSDDWQSRNLDKSVSQYSKTALIEYRDNFTFGKGNWDFTVPAAFHRHQTDIIELSQNIQRFVDGLDYLTGARMAPARLYSTDGSHSTIGVKGQRSVANLDGLFRHNQELLKKFNEKLVQVVGMEVEFHDVWSSAEIMGNLVDLRVGRPEEPFKLLQLPDVGFGVSQVLPLIASTFYDNQTLLVEEAESNLHPAAQAKLMDVLLNSILEEGTDGPSLILETHSEHFLLALQNHLRMEGGLSDDDVSIIYVENQDSNEHGKTGSIATRIQTVNGEFVIPWPRDTWGDPTNPII